jgi:hypothetical protein
MVFVSCGFDLVHVQQFKFKVCVANVAAVFRTRRRVRSWVRVATVATALRTQRGLVVVDRQSAGSLTRAIFAWRGSKKARAGGLGTTGMGKKDRAEVKGTEEDDDLIGK